MDQQTHLAWLATEVDRYRAGLTASDPGAPVAACPGWSVSDLTEHLGTVHRWSAMALTVPPEGPAPSSDASPTGDGLRLAEWFDAGATALTAALRATAADTPCWTIADPRTARFWARRQAHETAMHRWDLEAALGRPAAIDPELALDGIDEVLDTMLPRQVRLKRIPVTSDWVRLVVDGRELTLSTRAEDSADGRDEEPVATVSGSAQDVLLLLWGRCDPALLEVAGDRDRLAGFLARPHVP